MKYALLTIAMLAVGISWVSYTNTIDERRMKVEYCWDADGNHYEASNPYCQTAKESEPVLEEGHNWITTPAGNQYYIMDATTTDPDAEKFLTPSGNSYSVVD